MPRSETISATILADEAADADVIATICSVLTVPDSLSLVASLPGVECFLMTASGATATSTNWPQTSQSTAETTEPTNAAVAPKSHEMIVEFEISKAANSRRYRRPYVGVWVEDEDGFPVKTLSLFLMQNSPGPRWYRDLRRWYSDDQLRLLVDDKDLIGTISKPTRNPGNYKVKWDGRDDGGDLLEAGEYVLLIESCSRTWNLPNDPTSIYVWRKALRATAKGQCRNQQGQHQL